MSNDNAELLACGGYRANVHFKCIAITISPSTYIGIESTRSGEPEVYLSKVLEIVRNHCLYTLLGLTGFPQATEPTIYLYMTFHHTFVLNFFFVGVSYDVKSLTHTTHTIHSTSTSFFFSECYIGRTLAMKSLR